MSAEVTPTATPPKRDRSPDGTLPHPSPAALPSALAEMDAEAYERQHVHTVYDAIATHFSSTRYKPWPRVVSFLAALPVYAAVADVGCGNGKYFAAALRARSAPTVSTTISKGKEKEEEAEGGEAKHGTKDNEAHRWVVGMDYSGALLQLTQRSTVDPNIPLQASRAPPGQQEQPYTDCLCCDGRRAPFRAGTFDAAISIAVVHHYATVARRRAAVVELLRLVRRDGGLVLLYVWALDDDKHHEANQSNYNDNNSNKNEAERKKTNVETALQPAPVAEDNHIEDNKPQQWHRKEKQALKPKSNNNRKSRNQQLDRRTGDALIRWQMNQKFDTDQKVFERFYHFFTRKELEELCVAAAEDLRRQETEEAIKQHQSQSPTSQGNKKTAAAAAHCRIKECYLDCENWCIILERYVD